MSHHVQKLLLAQSKDLCITDVSISSTFPYTGISEGWNNQLWFWRKSERAGQKPNLHSDFCEIQRPILPIPNLSSCCEHSHRSHGLELQLMDFTHVKLIVGVILKQLPFLGIPVNKYSNKSRCCSCYNDHQ